MKGKFVLGILLLLFVFLITLPVLVNQLMRVDWFSKIVVGEEGVWISFYGSYLGGIIGGLLTLVGVIITIDYQKRTHEKTSEETIEKNTKVIDTLVDSAIANLLYFITIDSAEDYEIKEHDIKMMKISLKRLQENKNEMNSLSWEIIPHKFFKEFTHIRDLVNILEDEISRVLEDPSIDYTKVKENLSKAIINRRVKTILEQYIKFASNKELMEGLSKEI